MVGVEQNLLIGEGEDMLNSATTAVRRILSSDHCLVLGASLGLAFGLPQVYFLGVIAVPVMDHYGINTDWFGAIVGFMAAGMYFFSPVAGVFVDRHRQFGAALAISGGLLLIGVSLIAASFAPGGSLAVIIALGVAGSISVGMTYTIGMSAVASRYQGSRKGLATGVAAAGLAVGTISGSLLVEMAVADYGVTTALLWMGFSAAAAVLPVGLLLASVDAVPAKSVDSSAVSGQSVSDILLSRNGLMICLAFLLTSPVLLIAFSHIGVEVTATLDSQSAAYVVSVLAVAGLPFRLLAGSLSDRFGPLNILVVTNLTLAVSFLVWMFADGNLTMYSIFAIIYGFSHSSIVVMRPLIILEIFGRARINTVTGVMYFISGPGCLLGAFAFGWVFDGTYDPALRIAIPLCCASAFVAFMARGSKQAPSPYKQSVPPVPSYRPPSMHQLGIGRLPTR